TSVGSSEASSTRSSPSRCPRSSANSSTSWSVSSPTPSASDTRANRARKPGTKRLPLRLTSQRASVRGADPHETLERRTLGRLRRGPAGDDLAGLAGGRALRAGRRLGRHGGACPRQLAGLDDGGGRSSEQI